MLLTLHPGSLLLFEKFVFLIVLYLVVMTEATAQQRGHNDHLVVIAHGIMGKRTDLNYLAGKLEAVGFHVLRSGSNELTKSLVGVEVAAKRLQAEIEDEISQKSEIRKISFVGNSLGGLFVRYVVKLLYDPETKTIAGLEPVHFMTIATPHLGVSHHTAIEEYNLYLPAASVKSVAASFLRNSGKEIFSLDAKNPSESLYYTMATTSEFLDPIKAFKARRLYGNLNLDFVVPLGTAAFLPQSEVLRLRQLYRRTYGIVHRIPAGPQTNAPVRALSAEAPTDLACEDVDETSPLKTGKQVTEGTQTGATAEHTEAPIAESVDISQKSSGSSSWKYFSCGSGKQSKATPRKLSKKEQETEHWLSAMREGLESCSWEKVVVHLHGILPLAHNKICAMTKSSFVDSMMGHAEGRFVIDDVFDWFTSGDDFEINAGAIASQDEDANINDVKVDLGDCGEMEDEKVGV